MPERTFTRIGSISAIVGAVIFMAGNMLHARSSDIEITAEQVKAVAGSDIWVTDHLLFVLGALLMVGGLVALQRSITSEPGASWARFGYLGAIVSSGLGRPWSDRRNSVKSRTRYMGGRDWTR